MPRISLRRREPTIIMRADRAREAGQWQVAAGLYRIALDRTPDNPPIWIQYGHALKESGNRAEAETAYRTAIALAPDDADPHLQLGHVLKLEGRTAEAQASYMCALALDHSLTDAARELSELGRAEEPSPEPNGSRAPAALAVTAAANGHAIAHPLRRGKDSIITRADRAREAGQWPLAARLYRKALDRNPKRPDIWVQYGHALKESSRLAEAESAYRAAIARDPAAADPHLQLGHVLKLQGKTEEAEAAYLRAFATGQSLSNPLGELHGRGWSEAQITELQRLHKGDDSQLLWLRTTPNGPDRSTSQRQEREEIATALQVELATLRDTLAEAERRVLEREEIATAVQVELATLRDTLAEAERQVLEREAEAVAAQAKLAGLRKSLAEADGVGVAAKRNTIPQQGAAQAEPERDAQAHAVLSHDVKWVTETIRASRLFDENYYRSKHPDLPTGIDLVRHFVEWGAREGRRPHPCFDPAYYVQRYPDVAQGGQNPFLHFLQHGMKEGRSPADLSYPEWCAFYDSVSDSDRIEITARIARMQFRPLISVIVVVGNAAPEMLARALRSVERQLYSAWELWIAMDSSAVQPIHTVVQQFCAHDNRARVVVPDHPGTRQGAVNTALSQASGEFVAFMGSEDELSELALYLVVEELNLHRDTDLIYGDEDQIDVAGHRKQPFFKPDWNIDLFYGYNYVGEGFVCRTALVRQVGSLRPMFEGAQQYDLCLRIIESTHRDRIRHIPSILYHTLRSTPVVQVNNHTANAARHALSQHFIRTGQNVEVVAGPSVGLHRVIRPVPRPHPLVSLVVPTRDGVDLLRNVVSGVLRSTAYDSLELVIVDNNSSESTTFAYFDEISADPRVTIANAPGAFNFSRICNLGVERARGEIIGLVNNDLAVIEPSWLKEMVGHVLRPEVGVVGAMLYYPDDTIQHAGVILGIGGLAGHIHRQLARGSHGYFYRAALTQDLSCVTAACQLVRRAVYQEVGGLDEQLAVDFNDVDFCLKLRSKGYLIVWTPFAELYHLETASRRAHHHVEERPRFNRELDWIRQKWGGDALQNDPYFNPNLRLDVEDYQIASPPRVVKPWLREP